MVGTGDLRFDGRSGQSRSSAGAFGSVRASVDPTMLNRPANGAGMPPNASHGPSASMSCSDWFACSGVTGVGPLPPSMNTSPASPLAPGLPLKSQVAYAVVIEPPSEWPPTTTFPPSLFAWRTTRSRSSTATRIPHRSGNETSASAT